MKDERIVKAFDSVDVDDASRQRMLDSLLAERERMVAQGVEEPVSPGDKPLRGAEDLPTISDARRRGATPTRTVLLRMAACLLVVAGIGAVALPMMSGSSSSSTSSSASSAMTDSTKAESSASGSEAANGETTSTTAGTFPGDDLAGASLTIDGVVYHVATSVEAVNVGLPMTIPESSLAGSAVATELSLEDGDVVSASFRTISGISQAQAVAVQREGASDWALFVVTQE